MGRDFIDRYSLLHFAAGFAAKKLIDIDFITIIILSIIFEFVENTDAGMKFIREDLWWWPGGKQYKDSIINQISDTIFVGLGWFTGKILVES